MGSENYETLNQSNNIIPKAIFAHEYQHGNRIIASIADDMQSMLTQAYAPFILKKNNNYLYQIASQNIHDKLVTMNSFYEHSKKRPPKKPIMHGGMHHNKFHFNKIDYLNPPKRDKNLYGKEQSVLNHQYNDYLPMALSVDDFKSLYIPKTVKYIWSSCLLDHDVGMALKADLQSFLGLTDIERVEYMDNMTTIRNVVDTDIQDDACDKELLGHRGIFAAQDIPAMSIIGIYSGIFIKDAEDMIRLMQKMPLEYFQDYLFRIPTIETFPKISGYQYGNRLSIINAASNYKNGEEETSHEICRRANLMLITAKTGECPIPKIADNDDTPDMLFFVAGRDIPKGKQLLYDYGNVYW